MDLFPYWTSYILIYFVSAFLVLILIPAPYGKFARASLPLQINSRVAWAINEIGGLFVLFGYFEDGKWITQLPSTDKGWVCYSFVVVHFLWRAIISQIVLESIDPPRGTKETSIIIPLLGLLVLPAVGMNFRHMSVQITDTYEFKDTIFIMGALLCLAGNAFVDVMFNIWRKEKKPMSEYYGSYLTIDEISERFGLLGRLGIDCPNYFFEILEWGFFSLFAFRWEAFWWFVCVLLYLLPRSIWTSHWHSIPVEKERKDGSREVETLLKPQNVVPPTAVVPKNILNNNKFVF